MSDTRRDLEDFFDQVISQLGGSDATVNRVGNPCDGRYEFMAAVCRRCHRVEMPFDETDSMVDTVQLVVSLMLSRAVEAAVGRVLDTRWNIDPAQGDRA